MKPTNLLSQPAFADPAKLAALAELPGPCVSLYLAAHRPGAADPTFPAQLQSLFRTVDAQQFPGFAARMEQEIATHGGSGGGQGMALIASPDTVEIVRYTGATAGIFAGDEPFLLPLVPESNTPNDFFVLALNKGELRLYYYRGGNCQALELPAGMPASVEEFHRQPERADHVMQHSPAGQGHGDLKSVRFGASASRDEAPAELDRFFAHADAALKPLLAGRCLLLMGVPEEVARFRRAAKSSLLFESPVLRGVQDRTVSEIAHLARESALSQARFDSANTILKLAGMEDRRRVIEGYLSVAEAARAGRVQLLGMNETGLQQDRINAAAIATLRHRGRLFFYHEDDAGPFGDCVALLRY